MISSFPYFSTKTDYVKSCTDNSLDSSPPLGNVNFRIDRHTRGLYRLVGNDRGIPLSRLVGPEVVERKKDSRNKDTRISVNAV